MTRDALESRIQDYLDGRMSESGRRAFEQRLAGDDELARRVRDYRSAAEALRKDSPGLSGDFYSRLRSRFEARHAPARRWFGLLSWETAGLVAAVVLVGALFVPFVLERRSARPESQIEGLESEEPPSIDEKDTDWAPSPARSPEPPRRDEPVKESSTPSPVAKPKKADKAVPLPSAPAETELRDESGRSAMRRTEGKVRARSEASVHDSLAPVGVVLSRDVVEAGAIVEIRSEEAWSRLVRTLGPGAGDALGEYDPSARIVLVGAREAPVDCARASVIEMTDAYEIRLVTPVGALPATDHGCAFRLPRDGRPVHVVDPSSLR